MIHSYPSIYAIGHKAIQGIFESDVLIEEKIDGSQFSFGVIDGELQCRSKGKQMLIDAPEKMFGRAVAYIKSIEQLLVSNWVYRCEYLEKPKHNTLAYNRIPDHHLMVYDINTGLEEYMSPTTKMQKAMDIGLETVPVMFQGRVDSFDVFQEFLSRESVLGGVKIEGVVVKNYSLFTQEKKVALGKYVSEEFKERHTKEWGESNPSQGDFILRLAAQYRTEARWNKAIQHLREQGKLEGSPRDIGLLIREVGEDILKECESEIKDAMFGHFWKTINRSVTSGLPDYYKKQLAESAFEETK